MKKAQRILLYGFLGLFLLTTLTQGQDLNTAGRMMQDEDKLTLGGYAQIDYNQPISNGAYSNGNLDVHRMVLMFGYKFDKKVQFISEIEFEHVKEVFVEHSNVAS